jgi:hypothetical protein
MTDRVLIEPYAIYDDGTLYQQMGITAEALACARRKGELRFTRKGKRTFYLGRWLLDWFQADGRKEVAGAQAETTP